MSMNTEKNSIHTQYSNTDPYSPTALCDARFRLSRAGASGSGCEGPAHRTAHRGALRATASPRRESGERPRASGVYDVCVAKYRCLSAVKAEIAV
eukprot:3480583-Prymnesium_polylepis.2